MEHRGFISVYEQISYILSDISAQKPKEFLIVKENNMSSQLSLISDNKKHISFTVVSFSIQTWPVKVF